MTHQFSVPGLPLISAGEGEIVLEQCCVRYEEVIKRSRFISLAAHVDSRQAALRIVEEAKKSYPGASHYCWAYVAGAPGDTARIGQSDDGEPHGTAGRPMLNQLLHCGMGEVAVVCIRYFGGIKLGTGGLARAYQHGAKEAVALIRPAMRQEMTRVEALIGYGCMDALQRLIKTMGGTALSVDYGERICIRAEIPLACADAFGKAFYEATDGEGVLKI